MDDFSRFGIMEEDSTVSTYRDGFSFVCGFYTYYQWEGNDVVYFEILSNEAKNYLASFLGLGLIFLMS